MVSYQDVKKWGEELIYRFCSSQISTAEFAGEIRQLVRDRMREEGITLDDLKVSVRDILEVQTLGREESLVVEVEVAILGKIFKGDRKETIYLVVYLTKIVKLGSEASSKDSPRPKQAAIG